MESLFEVDAPETEEELEEENATNTSSAASRRELAMNGTTNGSSGSSPSDDGSSLVARPPDYPSRFLVSPTVKPLYPDRTNGLYVADFSLVSMGSYKLSVKVHDSLLKGFPKIIEGIAGDIDLTTTYAEGSGTVSYLAGTEAEFEIYAKDRFGNAVGDPTLNIDVRLLWEGYVYGAASFETYSDKDILNSEFGSTFRGVATYNPQKRTYKMTSRLHVPFFCKT